MRFEVPYVKQIAGTESWQHKHQSRGHEDEETASAA